MSTESSNKSVRKKPKRILSPEKFVQQFYTEDMKKIVEIFRGPSGIIYVSLFDHKGSQWKVILGANNNLYFMSPNQKEYYTHINQLSWDY